MRSKQETNPQADVEKYRKPARLERFLARMGAEKPGAPHHADRAAVSVRTMFAVFEIKYKLAGKG
jgi:hypothetical protein